MSSPFARQQNSTFSLDDVTEFTIGAPDTARVGKYVPLYNRLKEAFEQGNGLFVPFPNPSIARKAIEYMNGWANDDGMYIEFGEWRGNGKRINLRKIEDMSDEEAQM